MVRKYYAMTEFKFCWYEFREMSKVKQSVHECPASAY